MLSRPAASLSRAGTAIEVAASNPSGKACRFMRKNPKLWSTHTHRVPTLTLPASAGLSGEPHWMARLPSGSTKEYSWRDASPSPPFRGEREGPVAQRREGEVGGAAHRPL